MIKRDEICAALVRAYCSVVNADKPIDVDLVDEMANEVMEAINRALERQGRASEVKEAINRALKPRAADA